MPLEPNKSESIYYKKCADCGMKMNFNEFLHNNPPLSKSDAIILWKNPLIKVYCCDCFLARPERPYKNRYTHQHFWKKD
jgi:hypothetical protein